MTTDAELRDRVARLEARAEIFDCVQRYARGIDRRDRELLRSAYHDDAVAAHDRRDPPYDRPLSATRGGANP
ncbi:nuclear transport factor 2 family protein [Mycobacterium sp. Aquia_213]|uniref:nuclear transport factor 2 family protein n=1 Tax=Mycobacterium sp. Aquia_213 TaxID=2991728 RepID=UPI0022720441|nr:nuclear transport factor 2 family protein [Mycobacterium sp. Aquia_213]WAC92201.1 nuclear transport factor 2 family protein [Mycobacterium sp. Aquia_213]